MLSLLRKCTLILILLSFFVSNVFATIDTDLTNTAKSDTTKSENKKKYRGSVTGSFETNTIYYLDDKATGAMPPKDNYGSNNYLKVDYMYKGFSAGIQAEWYPQPLQGYDRQLKGFAVPTKYISWQNRYISATIGDFYDQFGSGLILRAWEDKALGFNNSLGGARVAFNIKDMVYIKALSGLARENMWYSNTLVSGFDLSMSISEMAKLENHNLSIEGSFVDRYEMELHPPFEDAPKHVMSYSARMYYDYKGLNVKYEYVGKTKDLFPRYDALGNEYKDGKAHLAEIGYNGNGLSVLGAFRYLDNMMSPVNRGLDENEKYESNRVNYIPSLTAQHTYMLASRKPYDVFGQGEVGGQVDLYYRVKRGTVLGGKRGINLHANFSLYYSLDDITFGDGNKFMYGNFTFDIEKSWNSKLKTTLFVSLQKQAAGIDNPDYIQERNTFVYDMTYKFNRKYSLKAEVQYLYESNPKEGGEGDWVAAMLEFNIAPKWSVFVRDMYNHGNTNIHYYSGGFSFTHSVVRVALNFGRYKEGYMCSGGVCKLVPAYTGLNLSVIITL